MKEFNKTIIIGDVHGCLIETKELLLKCNYDPLKDRVLFLGDLIDRGPDVKGVLDLAISIQKSQGAPSSIIGNHELSALRQSQDSFENQSGKFVFCHRTGITMSEFDTVTEWLYSLNTYEIFTLREKTIICAHAGIWPGRNIEDQKRAHLCRIQLIRRVMSQYASDEDCSYLFELTQYQLPDWVFWGEYHRGPELVVFGHTFFETLLFNDNFCTLDGGCCFGGELRALILPEMRVVTVPSKTKVADSRVNRHSSTFMGHKFY